eukprot:CAMPEP_0173385868 /NCGR_PEP_ID=MMETSP1356-20130122/8466_1 /TAXON_ID=77927 ORGANISM="Hemiselmis virescens, Strain PCC157" /NCGR_SAMPLE_ID=MMETSP1356 /ASSEMBLY_ACC=CAM_ASM_000847 /LENGTH=225 /DNA_ID=CAMNT_0014341865 /DNA_START=38 /DNA_END=715 /DNA_ORIENTATION=+
MAFASNDGPRLTNRTVMESETGAKFPPVLVLDPTDETDTVRFLGAGCVSHRNWRFKKVNDYAVGLYLDADQAYKTYKKKVPTPEAAREALLRPGVKKTIRVVLARETDTFRFAKRINDKIESSMAQEHFGDLMWLELWRDWMIEQGGYHTKLPKGVEIRMTWEMDEETNKDMITTEIRRRDRVLATKRIHSKTLAKGLFASYLGESPLSESASNDIAERMMNLCR